MNRYIYEIDENNAIRVWDTENPNEENLPFFFQPEYPNGDPWKNKEDAENWAKLFIKSLENPNSEFVPGESADNPIRSRIIAE